MKPRIARPPGRARPTLATTPSVVAPYSRMQSITTFARFGGRKSACRSSAYGGGGHCCGLGRFFFLGLPKFRFLSRQGRTGGGGRVRPTVFFLAAAGCVSRVSLRY